MTDTEITVYALTALVVAVGGLVSVLAHLRIRADRRAEAERLTRRMRQVESDRARFAGGLR